jgi:glycosyltransferase involved in cell wall biosynthesis
MRQKPRITVVTPSLNQGRFIGETIESVIRQGYDDLEYVIVDGGSTDETHEVVSRYASSIDEYISEPDGGQAEAINKGMRRATGQILCWLNSDDVLEPGALRTVAEIHQRQGFQFLYGDGWLIREGQRGRKRIRPGPVDLRSLRVRDPIQQPSAFWSRDLLDRVDLLDETLHYVFDWDFFIRIAQISPLRYHPSPFSTYRIHAAHKSSSGGRARSLEVLTIIHRYGAPEWRAAFDDVWEVVQGVEGGSKTGRVLRGSLLLLKSSHLLRRHSPGRLQIALRGLL